MVVTTVPLYMIGDAPFLRSRVKGIVISSRLIAARCSAPTNTLIRSEAHWKYAVTSWQYRTLEKSTASYRIVLATFISRLCPHSTGFQW